MKQCPSCRAELADDVLTCPHCGGSYDPDGGFKTPWDVEMARLTAEREDKLSRAERFGRLGRPIPHLFLDSRSGCLLQMMVVAVAVTMFVAVLAA